VIFLPNADSMLNV